MKKITFPLYDTDGTLTPPIVEAMAKGGVTSDYDPDNRDQIILTFDNATDANALLNALGRVVTDDAPVVDPTPAPDAAE